MGKRIWKTIASVKTTVWLLTAATLFFIIGSIYFRLERQVLPQLNFRLFQDWFTEFGLGRLDLSWWLYLLLLTLFLLGVNTAACILDRLIQLLPLWKKTGRFEFAVTIMPTLIHLVFFLILSGHLLSSITGSVETVACGPGQTIDLPGGRRIEVLGLDYRYHTRPESLAGRLYGAAAPIRFHTPDYDGEFTVKILAPVHRRGYSFHLDSLDKYAREKIMRLIIRRDFGIRLIIPGFWLIIAMMAWYFPALWRLKKKNEIKGA